MNFTVKGFPLSIEQRGIFCSKLEKTWGQNDANLRRKSWHSNRGTSKNLPAASEHTQHTSCHIKKV